MKVTISILLSLLAVPMTTAQVSDKASIEPLGVKLYSEWTSGAINLFAEGGLIDLAKHESTAKPITEFEFDTLGSALPGEYTRFDIINNEEAPGRYRKVSRILHSLQDHALIQEQCKMWVAKDPEAGMERLIGFTLKGDLERFGRTIDKYEDYVKILCKEYKNGEGEE